METMNTIRITVDGLLQDVSDIDAMVAPFQAEIHRKLYAAAGHDVTVTDNNDGTAIKVDVLTNFPIQKGKVQ